MGVAIRIAGTGTIEPGEIDACSQLQTLVEFQFLPGFEPIMGLGPTWPVRATKKWASSLESNLFRGKPPALL